MNRVLLLLLAAVGAALLRSARRRRERETERIWSALAGPTDQGTFDPSTVDDLPPPARRFLRRAIAPGTTLRTTLQLSMHGAIRLKDGAEPLPMQADQILAPPHGFVWRARVAKGPMRIRGFDRYGLGKGVLRWWLYGIIPIVRGSGRDVDRSAAGRLGGESVLVPASLLPGSGARWEARDDRSARVTVAVDGEAVTLTLSIDSDGRLERVSFMRWRGEGSNGSPGYVRFDVDQCSRERTFDGCTIPTRFRAGWRLGEPDEFPFFYAEIDEAAFL